MYQFFKQMIKLCEDTYKVLFFFKLEKYMVKYFLNIKGIKV